MADIKQIYFNDFGTSFYWMKDNKVVADKIQLIFRETGFYFSREELYDFKDCIQESYSLNKDCADCQLKRYCQQFLLKTPCSQIDLAMTMEELNKVEDLVEGTLFKINLEDYLYGIGLN